MRALALALGFGLVAAAAAAAPPGAAAAPGAAADEAGLARPAPRPALRVPVEALLPPDVPRPRGRMGAVPAPADGPVSAAKAAVSAGVEQARPKARPGADGAPPPAVAQAAGPADPRPRPRGGAPAASGGDTPAPAAAGGTAPATLDARAAALAPVPAQAPATLRPRERPGQGMGAVEVASAAIVAPGVLAAVARSLRPEARPARLPTPRRAAPPAPPALQPAAIVRPAPGGDPVLSRRGALCGSSAIQGQTVAPITGRIRGCGIPNPVRVTAVGGVRLSQPALMDCPTAQALLTWVERGAKPAVGRTGGGLATLDIAAHYVCRSRNHKRGAPLSEHARGRAIDIRALVLANGQRLEVQGGFRGPYRDILRAAYRSACGPFGTTLGPGSDGYHQDHFHLDTARRPNGPHCR